MNVTEMKQALSLCYEAKVPVMIWGHHGMAKSSCVRQLAQEQKVGFVDFRCSQIEASDLRGWPTKHTLEDGSLVTTYCPPAELPRSGSGYMFLDELNRADDPVIQAAFQLIVERRIGTYQLPDGWMVVAACNYTEGYHVNNFCQAFIGRFCHLEMTPSEEFMGDWSRYMLERFENKMAASRVVQFIGQNQDNLASKKHTDLGFQQEPSPRIWEMIARIEEKAGEYPPAIVRDVRSGLLGTELAIAYEKASFDIDPKELVDKGMKTVLPKIERLMEKMSREQAREQFQGLVWGVIAYATSLKKIKEEQAENVFDFAEWLREKKQGDGDNDLAIVMIMQCVKSELNMRGATAVIINKHLAKLLAGDKKDKTQVWMSALHKREKLYKLTETLLTGE